MVNLSRPRKKDNSRYKKGMWAENFTKMYLRLKGYKIVEHRYKTPAGEIDILARKGINFIVVEVKYRKNMDTAFYSITDRQKQRLMRAGAWVMSSHGAINIRFDAVLISPSGIKHIKNAFGQD